MEKGQESHEPGEKAFNSKRESPNIFLNLSDQKNRHELRWWALLGVIIQLGVLIFSAVFRYVPHRILKIAGQTPASYAYPFMASGTVILVFGMLICSHVVEQRSVEDVLQIQEIKGHLCWLQRAGEVGDQQFDSFAMFARNSRDLIRTSRLLEWSRIGSKRSLFGGLVRTLARHDRLSKISKEPVITNPKSSPHHLIYKAITTMACFISILGFIIQFIGLRGMHWSATITELIATIVMAGVRAWVRRDLALRPRDQKLSMDHELDWIATRIVRDYDRLWPDMKGSEGQLLPDEDDGFWEQNCWNWRILSGTSTNGYNLSLMAPQVSYPHSVVAVRKRLGSLSNWSGPVSDLAVSVASVIEAVMSSLCTFSDESYLKADSMYWSVNSGANGKADENNEQIFLKLNKVGRDGPWKADAAEIEAVLSLWLYSVQHKEHDPASFKKPKGNEQLIPREDWLSHGDTAIRQENLRFLGRCLPSSCRDLIWYMGSQASVISIVKEQIHSDVAEKDGEFGGADIISIDDHRVVGFRDNCDNRETGLSITFVARSKVSMYELWMNEQLLAASSETDTTGCSSGIDNFETSSNQLAVFSDHDLKLLLAQDLFSAFMWAIAKKMDSVDGETRVHRTETATTSNTTSWKNFKLENSKLSKALQAFEKAKLGSFEDACLCVIPPLSRERKLPDALPVIRHAQEMAEKLEPVGRLEEAGEIYISWFQVGKTFHPENSFSLKATAILFEFLALVNKMVKSWREQHRDLKPFLDIPALETKLLDEVKTASQSQLENLSCLYRLQSREVMIGLLGASCQCDHIQDISEVFNRCGCAHLYRDWPMQADSSQMMMDFKDLLGWTPWHYMATGNWQKDEHFLNTILKQTNQDSKNLMGWTALHIAAQNGYVSAGWGILQGGGQLEARGRDGMRALHFAVEMGHTKMVE